MYLPQFRDDTTPFDCSIAARTVRIDQQAFQSPIDLFTSQSPSSASSLTADGASACAFPQLTAGGYADAFAHGRDLTAVYGDAMGLFRTDRVSPRIQFRVTNNPLTSQTAAALIAGIFSETNSAQVLLENPDVDSLEPTYACAAATRLAASYGKTSTSPAWTPHLARTQDLRRALGKISGVGPDATEWSQSWDHYFDNLSSRQCNDLPLPCLDAGCVTRAQTDEVFRLGQYEYAYLWRVAPESLRMAVASYGVWVAELLDHIAAVQRDVKNGKLDVVRYFHNIAHDGSISRLLAILQVDRMVWPGMGAELIFEIYSCAGHLQAPCKWRVRVLWGGRPLQSSHPSLGAIDMIELSRLTDYLRGLVGDRAANVVALCSAS